MIIETLNAQWEAGNRDPDLLARYTSGQVWVLGANFTDEMCAEWENQLCVYYQPKKNDTQVWGVDKSWMFWFNKSELDRAWLRSQCTAIWFCRLDDYVEGILPCVS